MVFDPFSWATSFILNNAGKDILEKHFKDLSTYLSNTVKAWESGLPDDLHFNIEALFSHVSSGEDSGNFPARKELSNSFKQAHIPTKNIWFNALFERWSQLKSNKDETRPFFLQPQEDAEICLRLLSDQLEKVCTANKALFQSTTISNLSDINKSVQEIEKTVQEIKKSVQEQEFEEKSKQEAETDVRNGLDNKLINELAVAGYVNEAGGARRAVYLDKDQLYVHRQKAEKRIFEKIDAFTNDPQENNQWVSIIGDAGQGKSSLLWFIFNSLKKEGLAVYCILAQLSGSETLDRLDEAYPLFQKSSIIILDTLDLLVGVDNARLVAIINGIRLAGHLIFTSCRRQEIRGIPLRCDVEIELNLYSDDEALQAINNYIRAFYPKMSMHEQKVQFDNIWNILDAQRRIQELDLDPLILSMTFQTYIPDKIPQDINTQKIYAQFWQARVLDDRKPSEDEKRIRVNLCLLLARCIVFLHEGTDSFDIDELTEEWCKKRKSSFPHKTLEKLVSSGILHWARGRTHIRFFHQTFLEYTAAIDILHASDSQREIYLSELYSELKDNIPRRNPILKQIAVQDFFEKGALYWNILESLEKIHTLLSLQIALEILGKIGNDGGRSQRLCQSWIANEPSQVATTVREALKHYPKSKVPVALDLLEPCLQTHEEIAIYCACGDKLALMDSESVYNFLQKRLPLLAKGSEDKYLSEKMTRIRDAMIKVFACGYNKALSDLYKLYPKFSTGQRAGLFSGLSQAINKDNCRDIGSFCDKIIESIVDSHVSEVRLSFMDLLVNLATFCKEHVKELSNRIYNSGLWEKGPKAAQFTGSLVGKFLLDQQKTEYFISNIDSSNPLIRVLSTWTIQEAGPHFHELIIKEFIRLTHPDLHENSRQMFFKIVSRLNNISQKMMTNFLEVCPWPNKALSFDEFKLIWSFLADKDEQATKKWLWAEIQKANGSRHQQLFIGLLVLMSKNIQMFCTEELRHIYKMACFDEVIGIELCDYAGLFVYGDNSLANDIYRDLLQSPKQDIRTTTVRSLALSINDHLEFALTLGDLILVLSGKRDHYGLMHCYLNVLQKYSGDNSICMLEKIDTWFNEQYFISFQDETAIVGLLSILKKYAIKNPELVFQIAQRCPISTQGVAGALSAVYANIIVSLNDSGKLLVMLHGLMEIIKTQQGRGQRRIRNSLRMSIPYLVRKLGAKKVFEVFFEKYNEIDSPYALEDLVGTIVVVTDWSDIENKRLLNDTNLPPQVRSIVLSRASV